MKRIELVVLAALSVTACGKDGPAGDLCTRGVTHVMRLMATDGKAHGGEPEPDEQRVIDAVQQVSIQTCRSEGFTQAQLDCLLAVTDWESLAQAGACAAIKARRPSWLHLP